MSLTLYFAIVAGALIVLGIMSLYQTARAVELKRQIELLEKRADTYAAALLRVPDKGGMCELIFADKSRGIQAEMEAAAIARATRRAKPTAADFARHVPAKLVAHELRSIRATLDGAATLPPGGNPATLHEAARSIPMPPPVLPLMLDGAGIALGVSSQRPDDTGPCETAPPPFPDGGAVTTPGSFA